ncbi:phosphatidylinositol-3-phosphatase SAC1-like [Anticarsia gemmatalis]|uniref:phosphatidylinositol-3-phosphatase SAC1-like n=1 Tax=Anticarsia gemmatalis TaxID=129554 RepID=UPI003F763B39
MEDKSLVHECLQLFTTSDKFYLKPSQLCCNSTDVLIIDRATGDATVKDIDLVKLLGSDKDFKLIFGFLGSIKLISGLYLVVITDRTLVGKLNGHEIYQVEQTEIIPYARSTRHLTSQQITDNDIYERMVRSILELPGAYFSSGYDLTHTVQKLQSCSPDFFKKSLVSRADARFLWNRHLLKDFTHEQYGRFTMPLIQGFVSINHVEVNGHKLTWSLISRRGVDRTGTRLFVRGIDDQGNVANHVLTEQIIQLGDNKSSFILTRGSVPLPWTQYPDLTYIPTADVAPGDHVDTFVKHFNDQKERYGNVVCVNLIGGHGKEGILESGYRATATAAALPGVKYQPFDFHTECSSLRYDKLNILVSNIANELKEFGYFFSRGDTVSQRQTGTFRVNCLDCLDRTNVVQSILAKLQLQHVLKQLGVSADDEDHPKLNYLFNHVWADHADMISTQYSGTGALKTDFTRTGKRTHFGLLKDAANATVRYCMNNFTDGFKQDAFDVYLGNYVIPEGEGNTVPSPLRRKDDWKYYTIPSVFLTAVSLFFATIIFSEDYSAGTVLYLLYWAGIAAVTFNYICRNGKKFVDWPKLCAGERAAMTSKPKSL